MHEMNELLANVRDTELLVRFHLINLLPGNVAFLLKLWPKKPFEETISKERESSDLFIAKQIHVQDTVATSRLG